MSLEKAVQDDDGARVRTMLRGRSITIDVLQDALTTACRFGRLQAAKALLETDPHGQLIESLGPRLLHDACVGGHVAVAGLLLDCGVDPEARNNRQWSPSHTAAYHGELPCLEALANCGADCGVQDPQGHTPCHLASERNHPRILDFLGREGYDLEQTNVKGQQPIHLAAKHGALECLILFVQLDCDPNATDSLGKTPAHYTAGGDHIECLRFLVHHGANKEVADKNGRTLAHTAAAQGAMSCLHWLLEKDPLMVNYVNRNLDTPAHLAAAKGHAKCFHCCLQHDADLTLTNDRRETATETGKRYGHPLVIEKACKNEVQCVHCRDTSELLEWERNHQPNVVQRMIRKDKKTIFTSPLPKVKRGEKKSRSAKPRGRTAGDSGDMPQRDLVARYLIGNESNAE